MNCTLCFGGKRNKLQFALVHSLEVRQMCKKTQIIVMPEKGHGKLIIGNDISIFYRTAATAGDITMISTSERQKVAFPISRSHTVFECCTAHSHSMALYVIL
jgi:hypothetical protein